MTDYSQNREYARHGGAYDRGGADSWYMRPRNPHYRVFEPEFKEVPESEMTEEEIKAYHQGYDDNEAIPGAHKDYGR